MTEKKETVSAWSGEFGASYIERNRISDDVKRQGVTAFGRILDTANVRQSIQSVLEVGSNIGINQFALRELLPKATLSAVEPNAEACAALRGAGLGVDVKQGTAYQLPFDAESHDLVFTSGVLIHIPPDKLETAVREMARVSRRYLLCSEYFSHNPEEIDYRGQKGLLWKRDFGSLFMDVVPNLTVRSYGFLWQRELPHFDNLNWWVFEKSAK